MKIRPIRTKTDYRAALKEIDGLMSARRDTPEGERLDVLVTLVEAYERKHYPMDAPDPAESLIKPAVKPRSNGTRAATKLRGSLKHLRRSNDKRMALTRGEH